jgi:hypothetical protein
MTTLDFYKRCIDTACADYFSDEECLLILTRILGYSVKDLLYKNVISYFAVVHPLQYADYSAFLDVNKRSHSHWGKKLEERTNG